MKVSVEVVDGLPEDEVVIRCRQIDEKIQKIQGILLEQQVAGPKFVFYKQNREFYFPLNDILFFETNGEQVHAHTHTDAFHIKFRLYELEEMLPRQFVRVAKASIVNVTQIFSITRNLTAASLIQFVGTHKQVYASRHYYGTLRARMMERSNYES